MVYVATVLLAIVANVASEYIVRAIDSWRKR